MSTEDVKIWVKERIDIDTDQRVWAIVERNPPDWLLAVMNQNDNLLSIDLHFPDTQHSDRSIIRYSLKEIEVEI